MMDLYCTQCHRECDRLDDDDPDGQAEMLSHCHAAPTLSGNDKWIVMAIRRMWAADSAILNGRKGHLGGVDRASFDPDYPFGVGSLDDPEVPNVDLFLLTAFNEEREHHDDDLHTIWVLIRG